MTLCRHDCSPNNVIHLPCCWLCVCASRCLEFTGHLALPIMLATLCEEGVAHLMGDARALYEHHERDAGDTILCAFKAGNWTKVLALTSPNFWSPVSTESLCED